MKQIQQGDVLIRQLDAMPVGGKTIAHKRCVLAEGEATGHAHVIEDDEAELVRVGDKIILSLKNAGTVFHEEHKPVALEAGIWEIDRVREYDYFSKMVSSVRD